MKCDILLIKKGTVLYRANQSEHLPMNLLPNEEKFWANSIYFSDTTTVFSLWNDTDHPYLLQVKAKRDMKCIFCDQYDFSSDAKELLLVCQVERLIERTKPSDKPFMKWLGEEGYVFKCYADEDMNTEYAVPFVLLNNENWEESKYSE